MAYSIRIEPIGEAGTPKAQAESFEVPTEMEAIALATYEVDVSRFRSRRIATVFDGAGGVVLTYAGRADGPDGATAEVSRP